jgi:hypothetical protein
MSYTPPTSCPPSTIRINKAKTSQEILREKRLAYFDRNK